MTTTRQFIVEVLDAQGVVSQRIAVDRVTLVSSVVTGSPPGGASSFSIVDGNNQTSAVSTPVAARPSVRVVDANNQPVSGTSVSFIASGQSGVVSGAQQTTNGAGVATVTSWSLGTIVGTQRMYVKAGSMSTQTFTATAIAGSAFSISASGGTSQTTHVGAALPSRLTVLVHDDWSNPVSDQSVELTSTDNESEFGESVITTNANGVVGTTYTVGISVGASVATMFAAISSTTSTQFAATSTASVAAGISIVEGDGQVGEVSSVLTINPQVAITDYFGNRVASSQVTWSAGAGSLSTARTPTSSVGTAATVWTLGSSGGTQLLTARGDFLSDSTVTFDVSASDPAPTLVALFGGNSQSATVGAALTSRLTVRLTTGSGASASGVNVAWTTSQGTLGASQVASDADGYAGVAYSVGTTAVSSIVTATVSGVTGSPITFAVSATTAAVSSLTYINQPSSNVVNGQVFPQQPQLQIIDKYGNSCLSNGVTVSIQTASGAVALSGTTNVATGATGRAVYTNLVGTGAGQNFTLNATSSSLTAKTSDTVTIGGLVASKLAFTVPPSGTAVGSAINPAVKVAVQNATGATVTSATDLITVAISAGGSISGTLTVAAVSGIATFSNLLPGTVGTGFTLTATSGSLTSAVSVAFNVTAVTQSGQHPNEPSGYTRFLEHNCAVEPATTESASGLDGLWKQVNPPPVDNLTVIDPVTLGSTAPSGNSKVWRVMYPSYQNKSADSIFIRAWDGSTSNDGAAIKYKEIYGSWWVRFYGANGSDFEMKVVQIKPFGFLAAAKIGGSGVGHNYWTLKVGAVGLATSMSLNLHQEGVISRNVPGAISWQAGTWYHYEFQAVLNTHGPALDGQPANGILKQWSTPRGAGAVTTLFCNRSDMEWIWAGNTAGFLRWHFSNTYGGSGSGSAGKTRDDIYLIDAPYFSGILQ